MNWRQVSDDEVETVLATAGGDPSNCWLQSNGRWVYQAKIDGRWIRVIRRPDQEIHTVIVGRQRRPKGG